MRSADEYTEAATLALAASNGQEMGQAMATIASAQVYATLAQAAATERVAMAVENLPTYEGMLSVYTFGGGR